MNAVAPFPNRQADRDLTKHPAAGYSAITRKVALIIDEHQPATQAARLTVRAAVIACTGLITPAETATALRALADEVEAMR